MIRNRLMILLLVLCAMLLPVASLADADSTVTVTGTATFSVDADTAVLNIGVESSAAEATKASQKNAADVAAVTAALIEAGIAEADIRTNYYYVNTLYRFDDGDGSERIAGYQVNNNLSVTVRDIARIGEIIDIALNSGANRIDGITFSSSGENLNDEALAAAVKEARRKAEIVAEAVGLKLGGVVSIVENYSTYTGPMFERAKGANAMAVEAEADAGTSINPSGLTFSATVTVTFELDK